MKKKYQRRKRILGISAIILSLLIQFYPVFPRAAETPDDWYTHFYYEPYASAPVPYIDLQKYMDSPDVTELSIPESVTIMSVNYVVRFQNDASHMFEDAVNLRELDLSRMDTSNVTDMTCMFTGCRNLEQLDISGFNTENVGNMEQMFDGCESLEELNLHGFWIGGSVGTRDMLSQCGSLEKIFTPAGIGGNVEIILPDRYYDKMGNAFTALTAATPAWVTLSKTYAAPAVSEIILSENEVTLKEGDTYQLNPEVRPIEAQAGAILDYGTSAWDVAEVDSRGLVTAKSPGEASIRVAARGTSVSADCLVTVTKDSPEPDPEEEWLQEYDYQIEEIDGEECIVLYRYLGNGPRVILPGIARKGWVYFPVKLGMDGRGVFAGRTGITHLDLKGISMKRAAYDMLSDLTGLVHFVTPEHIGEGGILLPDNFRDGEGKIYTEVGPSTPGGLELDKREEWYQYFRTSVAYEGGVPYLELGRFLSDDPDLPELHALTIPSSVSIDGVTYRARFVADAGGMFRGSKLYMLDISAIDTGNVTNMTGMFAECPYLSDLSLGSMDTSKVKFFTDMFYGCEGLKELDLKNFQILDADTTDMLKGCTGLGTIRTPAMIFGSRPVIELPLAVGYKAPDGKVYHKLDAITAPDPESLITAVSYVPASGISISPSASTTIRVGQNIQFSASVQPEDATNKGIAWTSSDPAVAPVDEDGNVTGLSRGIVTITVTTADGASASGQVVVTSTGGGGSGGSGGGSSSSSSSSSSKGSSSKGSSGGSSGGSGSSSMAGSGSSSMAGSGSSSMAWPGYGGGLGSSSWLNAYGLNRLAGNPNTGQSLQSAAGKSYGNAKDMPKTGDGDPIRQICVLILFLAGCAELISSIPVKKKISGR